MKTFVSILIIGFVITIGHYVIAAQTVKQIQFTKGKSAAVVKGVTGTSGVIYSLRAKSGQKLILNLSPVSRVGIKVETDSKDGHEVLLREEKGGSYEIGLENDGEYTILIGSTEQKSVPFTLSVKITKLADI